MFENIIADWARADKKILLYQLTQNSRLYQLSARGEYRYNATPVSFASERTVLRAGQEVVSVAVNEALIPYPSPSFFPATYFSFAVLGMRSSGMADGPRPSVTTINHPDAIFAGAMEKLLARPAMCAHTLARTYVLHIR